MDKVYRWKPFKDEREKLNVLKNYKLTDKSRDIIRPTYYTDEITNNRVPCEIVGKHTHRILIVKVNDTYSQIKARLLYDMQPAPLLGCPINIDEIEIHKNYLDSDVCKKIASLRSYVTFDLETTGIHSSDEIIEIGAVKVIDGIITDTFHSLINPLRHIPPFINKLTGITDETVADSPYLCEVMPSFIEFIKGFTLIAHNINFDLDYLCDAMWGFDDMPNVITCLDTLKLARFALPELGKFTMSYLVEILSLSNTAQTHRADSDAEMVYKLFEFCRSRLVGDEK